jgi:hypothetical protein
MMSKKAATAAEMAYMGKVKSLPCSCCDAPGPSIAHHIREGQGASQRAQNWLTISLCHSCHVDGFLGIHGEKQMMKIMKMDEMDLLAKTIERLNS